MHTKTCIVLLGFIIGILSQELSEHGSEIAALAFMVGLVQISIVQIERAKNKKNMKQREGQPSRFSIAVVSALFFLSIPLGVIRTQFISEKNILTCSSACEIQGVVTSSPEIKNMYQVFTVGLDDDTYQVQVKSASYPQYRLGQRLLLTGRVNIPERIIFHNNVTTFDYAQYLRLHDIGSEMMYPKIEIVDGGEESSFVFRIRTWKEKLVSLVDEFVTMPAASLSSGMLFGKGSMSEELVQTFRVAGLSHIIVLSGFNIAILIGVVLSLLKFLPFIFRIIVSGLLVVMFVLMVGAEMSVVRATIMAFISLSALLFGRQYVASQALLVSLLCIIVFQPEALLYDSSLHLSFLATAGIVYMSEVLQFYCASIRLPWLVGIVTTTLAAYIATLPYVMHAFGTVSVYALIANMLVLPLVPGMMLLTFFITLFAPVSFTLASLFGYLESSLGNFVIAVARVIERLPFASFSVSLSLTGMFVLYACIVSCLFHLMLRVHSKRNETLLTKHHEVVSPVMTY